MPSSAESATMLSHPFSRSTAIFRNAWGYRPVVRFFATRSPFPCKVCQMRLPQSWGSVHRKFFHQHNSRSEERNEERIAAIYQATPATQDQAVLEACSLIVRGLVAVLATRSKERRVG